MNRFQILINNRQIILTGFEWWFVLSVLLVCGGSAVVGCRFGMDAGLREVFTIMQQWGMR